MLLKTKNGRNSHPKNERNAPIRIPSFVSRQDGCELSYEIEVIIADFFEKVKKKSSLQLAMISGTAVIKDCNLFAPVIK